MFDRLISAFRVLAVKKVVVVETYPDEASGLPVMTLWTSIKEPQEAIKLLREVTERYDRTVREQNLRKLEP